MLFLARLAAVLICASLDAQSPSQFEVASVKPTAKDKAGDRLSMMLRQARRENLAPGAIPMDDPGRIRLDNWALIDLIAAAYRVRATQVSGPSWLPDQGFDVEAKVPEGARKEQLNGMLQSLLEERFGLKVHHDSTTKPGFALLAGKNGPNLKPAELPRSEEERLRQQSRGRATLEDRMQDARANGTPLDGFRRDRWPSINTARLATNLVRFTEAPVVDETGLTGEYSVIIETWKNPDVPGGTIFDAVERLGLKLERRKIPVDTIVVDYVSKSPTTN